MTTSKTEHLPDTFPWVTRDEVFRVESPRLWLRWLRATDANALQRIAGIAAVAGEVAGEVADGRFRPEDFDIDDRFEDDRRGGADGLDRTFAANSEHVKERGFESLKSAWVESNTQVFRFYSPSQ